MLPCFYDQKPLPSFWKPEFLSTGPGKDMRWYWIILRLWSKLGHAQWPKSMEVWPSDVGSETQGPVHSLRFTTMTKTTLAQPQDVLVPCMPSNLVPMVNFCHMHKHCSLQTLLVFYEKSFTWSNKLFPFPHCGYFGARKNYQALALCISWVREKAISTHDFFPFLAK